MKRLESGMNKQAWWSECVEEFVWNREINKCGLGTEWNRKWNQQAQWSK